MGSCTEGGCRPWGGLTLHNGLLITQRADFRVHSGLRGMQKPFFHFRGKLQRLKPRPMKKTPMAPVTDFPWDLLLFSRPAARSFRVRGWEPSCAEKSQTQQQRLRDDVISNQGGLGWREKSNVPRGSKTSSEKTMAPSS